LPNSFAIRVVFLDGKEMKGNIAPADIRENIGWIYEDVFKRLEEQMPPVLSFTESETISIKQKIPQNPLSVCTALIEDDEGNITPNIRSH